jgi:N-acetylneuraminic acid mutarotase
MIGNNLYVSGGADSASHATNDLHMYDPGTNTWIAKASLPAGVNVYAGNAFTINGLGYVVDGELPGSYNYDHTLHQYDPVADQWVTKAGFPGTGGYTATSFAIGKYGYLGLGFSPYLDSFYRYDAQYDSWAPIASLPGHSRQGAVAFVINGFAYVGLGGYQSGSSFVNQTDLYKFDPSNGSWTAIAPFPDTPRIDAQAIALNGKGYVVAGMGATLGDYTNRVWEYDPQNNSWTQIDTFPVAFRSGLGISNETFGIVGLGINKAGQYTKQLWRTGNPTSIAETDKNITNVWFNQDAVHVKFQKTLSVDYSFALYDVSGREVTNSILHKGESAFDISLSKLSGGMYLYKINSSVDAGARTDGKILLSR